MGVEQWSSHFSTLFRRILKDNVLSCSCDLHWLQRWERAGLADLLHQTLHCYSNGSILPLENMVMENCSGWNRFSFLTWKSVPALFASESVQTVKFTELEKSNWMFTLGWLTGRCTQWALISLFFHRYAWGHHYWFSALRSGRRKLNLPLPGERWPYAIGKMADGRAAVLLHLGGTWKTQRAFLCSAISLCT